MTRLEAVFARASLLVAVAVLAGVYRLPLERQPFPDAVSYASLAASLAAGEGYRSGVGGEAATRYRLGFRCCCRRSRAWICRRSLSG